MSRKAIMVSYLTWTELSYIKRLLGAKSFDEMFKYLHKDMRRGVLKLHRDITENEVELMNRQYGGYRPKEDHIPESPVE